MRPSVRDHSYKQSQIPRASSSLKFLWIKVWIKKKNVLLFNAKPRCWAHFQSNLPPMKYFIDTVYKLPTNHYMQYPLKLSTLIFFFSQAHAVVVTAAMFAPVPWLIVPPDSSVHQTTTEVLVTADWSGAIKLFVNRWHAAALIWNIGGNCLAGLESPRHVVIQILCLTWWSTQIVNGNYVTIFFAYPRRTPVYSDVVSFAVYSALVLSFLYLARGTVVRWVMGRGLREMTSISLSVAVTLPVVPRAPLLILLAAVAIKT